MTSTEPTFERGDEVTFSGRGVVDFQRPEDGVVTVVGIPSGYWAMKPSSVNMRRAGVLAGDGVPVDLEAVEGRISRLDINGVDRKAMVRELRGLRAEVARVRARNEVVREFLAAGLQFQDVAGVAAGVDDQMARVAKVNAAARYDLSAQLAAVGNPNPAEVAAEGWSEFDARLRRERGASS